VLAAAAEAEALGYRAAVCFEGESVRPILVQFSRALPLNLVFACAAGGCMLYSE